MADVNWEKYNGDICRLVGFLLAGIVAGVVTFVLQSAGLSILMLCLVFLAAWAVLFTIVDQYCGTRAMSKDGAADGESPKAAAAVTSAAAAVGTARAAPPAVEPAAPPTTQAAPAVAAGDQDYDGDGVIEGKDEGKRPEALDGPRGGTADDLKRIKGIGPKLEQLCHTLGFYHFDQVAKWTADEVAWVDANLEGFKGRVTRDGWVAQATVLAGGGETAFSKRVDGGDVPSSQ